MKGKRIMREGDVLNIHSEESPVFMTVLHKDGELCLDYDGKLHAINKIYGLLSGHKG